MTKFKLLLAGVAMMAGCATAMYAQTPIQQGGVGPVISGSVDTSTLPEAAQAFIKQHFPDSKIVEVDKGFLSGTYEVELSDGTDIDFNAEGKAIEVDAPHRKVLSTEVVKHMIPKTAYDELDKRGFTKSIESVEVTPKHHKVELRGYEYDTVIFDLDGNLIEIVD